MTISIDISSVQPNLTDLLSSLAEGSEIILTQGDTPVAYLVPANSPSHPRIPGLHPGAIQINENFDQPLPDSFWTGNS
jgi:antitoxin (DNA-binding transcriptional repressor) of toxin-antitoxin stability system